MSAECYGENPQERIFAVTGRAADSATTASCLCSNAVVARRRQEIAREVQNCLHYLIKGDFRAKVFVTVVVGKLVFRDEIGNVISQSDGVPGRLSRSSWLSRHRTATWYKTTTQNNAADLPGSREIFPLLFQEASCSQLTKKGCRKSAHPCIRHRILGWYLKRSETEKTHQYKENCFYASELCNPTNGTRCRQVNSHA